MKHDLPFSALLPGLALLLTVSTLSKVEVLRPGDIPGLISWWKLDEVSDGSSPVTRIDSHGSNDLTDGTLTPSIADSPPVAAGEHSALFVTDRVNEDTAGDHLRVDDLRIGGEDQTLLELAGEITATIAFWIKPTPLSEGEATDNEIHILGKWEGGSGGADAGYAVQIDNQTTPGVNLLEFDVNHGGSGVASRRVTAATPLPDSIWTHVAITADYPNDTVSFYINGNLDSFFDDFDVTPVAGAVTPFTLGETPQGVHFQPPLHAFDGQLKDVAIWSTIIDPAPLVVPAPSPAWAIPVLIGVAGMVGTSRRMRRCTHKQTIT